MSISRRKLLKLSGGILAAAPFVRISTPAYAQTAGQTTGQTNGVITPIAHPLGRAFSRGNILAEPAPKAKVLSSFKAGDLIELTGETVGVGPTSYNPYWYQTKDGGFVHSALVHPCDDVLNEPVKSIDERGMWGEITVPVAAGRVAASPEAGQRFPAYYGLVVKIVGVQEGPDGKMWYEMKEDKWSINQAHSFFLAEQVRIMPWEEFDTLSPNIPIAKHIEVDLKKQEAVAFEDGEPVKTFRIASGMGGYSTPVGEHCIYVKTAGQRMAGGTSEDNSAYNLPAIPWISYFTPVGHAFHGTYWHNDYGRPRSHGCANVTSDDAKWIFRWSAPIVDYFSEDGFSTVTSKADKDTQGTRVIVRAG